MSELKKSKHNKYKKEKKDSSDISSYDSEDDNLTNEDIQKEAKSNYVQNELLERITKYLKIDNAIKEKQKEIREFVKIMKEQKESMEKYILGYLTEINEDYIKIDGEGKLIKKNSITKGAIKTDNIKASVIEGLKKENIILDEKKYIELLDHILNCVEQNRPKKEKTYIKRTIENKENNKNKKEIKKNTKKNIKKINNIQPQDSDEELPKYNG